MTLKKLGILCLSLGLFVFGFATKSFAIQVSLSSGTNFYTDFANTIQCEHISLGIKNSDGTTYSNLWVTVGSFTNTSMSLAGLDPGRVAVGILTNTQTSPAFF